MRGISEQETQLTAAGPVARFTHHRNAFGFLRLLFATLVMVSHAPEMADGNRSRELLTMVFGTLSFGELGVAGFFLISGYLITGSYIRSPGIGMYLLRRVGRIWPGFAIASLISIFVFAPLGGAHWSTIRAELPGNLIHILVLGMPSVPDAFVGRPYGVINGALWTIPYEFRCYLLVLVLGLAGMLRRPVILVALTLACFALLLAVPASLFARADDILPGGPSFEVAKSLRFTAYFLVGAIYYVARERIRFQRGKAVVAGILLVLFLLSPQLADIGVALFGSYLMFGLAVWGRSARLASINNDTDISYGTYLYGWPIQQLIFLHLPGLPLLIQAALAILLAYGAGLASWTLVEKPALARITRRQGQTG